MGYVKYSLIFILFSNKYINILVLIFNCSAMESDNVVLRCLQDSSFSEPQLTRLINVWTTSVICCSLLIQVCSFLWCVTFIFLITCFITHVFIRRHTTINTHVWPQLIVSWEVFDYCHRCRLRIHISRVNMPYWNRFEIHSCRSDICHSYPNQTVLV